MKRLALSNKSSLLALGYLICLGYFTYLMLLITAQYIPIDFEAAFLKLKEAEIKLVHYQLAFFTHVFTSIVVLLVGIPQFLPSFSFRFPRVHQGLGKIYVFLILGLASPSGLVMAYYANGGIFTQVSFSLQAILWFVFTYLGYYYIRQKDLEKHRNFMLRSFALTLSAISLRLLKWIIVATLQPPPMDTYKTVAWLGWLLNLAIVECYIWYAGHTFWAKKHLS